MDSLPASLPPLTFTGMLTLTGLDPVVAPLTIWKAQEVQIFPHPKDPQYLDFAYDGSLTPHDLSDYLSTRVSEPIRRFSGLWDTEASSDFVVVRLDYSLRPVDLGPVPPVSGSVTGLLVSLNPFGYSTPARFTHRFRLWQAGRVSQYGAALVATPRVWTVG